MFTAVMMLFPGAFIALFTADPEVHRVGVPYLRVLASCLVFVGLEVVVIESILGSGHTTVISWIFCTMSLVRIPLAFWVPIWLGDGVVGIAWLIAVTAALRTWAILAWAARGTWKRGLAHELRGAPAAVATAMPGVTTEPPGAP
jgi:Na+-driven multidrug efflux pump